MDEFGNTESSYWVVDEPSEQKNARLNEENKIKAGRAVIDDILARLQERIDFYGSVDSIDVDASVEPEEHLRIVIANKQTRFNLIQERDYWKVMRDTIK